MGTLLVVNARNNELKMQEQVNCKYKEYLMVSTEKR